MKMTPSSDAPDAYDRQLTALHDLPDVVRSSVATIRAMPPLGIGGSHVFIVQSYRQRERGDLIFLEVSGAEGTTRLVLPPAVANVIARQREALTAKARSRAAKTTAADRAARGLTPAFLKPAKKETNG
jgi:hypothetical protein